MTTPIQQFRQNVKQHRYAAEKQDEVPDVCALWFHYSMCLPERAELIAVAVMLLVLAGFKLIRVPIPTPAG